MNELHLFAGAGGGILGGILHGHRTVCAVEINRYCRQVLLQRQRDGILPWFPVWDDIKTFDGKPWQGLVDIVAGGFPCQDISAAGKGAGIEGARSGLWKEMARVVGEVRPRYVFVENSPMLVGRGLAVVLGDLADLGFDARWGVVSAADCGAPHIRKRIWILANATDNRTGWREQQQKSGEGTRHVANSNDTRQSTGCAEPSRRSESVGSSEDLAHAKSMRRRARSSQSKRDDSTQGGERSSQPSESGNQIDEVGNTNSPRLEEWQGQPGNDGTQQSTIERTSWWESEPDVGRVANGVAARVDRLRAIGNGQVPIVAATAWRLLIKED